LVDISHAHLFLGLVTDQGVQVALGALTVIGIACCALEFIIRRPHGACGIGRGATDIVAFSTSNTSSPSAAPVSAALSPAAPQPRTSRSTSLSHEYLLIIINLLLFKSGVNGM